MSPRIQPLHSGLHCYLSCQTQNKTEVTFPGLCFSSLANILGKLVCISWYMFLNSDFWPLPSQLFGKLVSQSSFLKLLPNPVILRSFSSHPPSLPWAFRTLPVPLTLVPTVPVTPGDSFVIATTSFLCSYLLSSIMLSYMILSYIPRDLTFQRMPHSLIESLNICWV